MLSRQFISDPRKYSHILRALAGARTARNSCLKQPGCRRYGGGSHGDGKSVVHKQITMDDLPGFIGPWQEKFAETQQRFNRRLFVGIAFFTSTAVYAWYSGALDYVDAPPMKNRDDKETAATAKSKSFGLGGAKVQPASYTKLPESVPYLLVGAGTASFSAFRAIRSADPTAKVLVIGEESYKPYMRPPLSKELWFSEDAHKKLSFKQWNGRERSIFFEHEDFYCRPDQLMERETGGIAVVSNCRVARIDSEAQKAILEDGREITYGKCLIATGGQPKNLPVFEKPELAGKVVLYRTVDDFKALDEASRRDKSVVIVGGGFLGSELACALGRRGVKTGLTVYQVFSEKGCMGRLLPEYLSRWTTEKVRAEGVQVISSTRVTDARLGPRGQILLKLSSGQEITADHVVVAAGLEPSTELAKASGLEVDDRIGGFKANAELEARSNLWVAGDALSFYDTKLGRRRIEHHDHAVVTGRLAGENMTGARKPYKHQSMFWSDLGPDVGYEAIGIVESHLQTVGVFARATEQQTEETVEAAPVASSMSAKRDDLPRAPGEGDDYEKGVVFYLRDDGVVVGIVLWNIFNRMAVARKIINEHRAYEDFSDLAKLFDIYSED
ncbi:apoptosis-inducing factor 1, mitochondrial-like [Dermacentor andersoni]|uniref:apoptosis-inducing factor 1, mitochondrial-like n=1 Tax=Dermacentor andersoni TaxID=34620 RepID=UPI002155DE50|nr:apoptosis-inducing factor 1, mitochondrial-like [Dermacentor andersoni]